MAKQSNSAAALNDIFSETSESSDECDYGISSNKSDYSDSEREDYEAVYIANHYSIKYIQHD